MGTTIIALAIIAGAIIIAGAHLYSAHRNSVDYAAMAEQYDAATRRWLAALREASK